MRRRPEDRAFARYCETGDPGPLGKVFDRTAGELLRVALHLSRDPQRAEDLVQTTFLEVLRQRGRYDRERPVLPWLLGILARQARSARRSEARATPLAEEDVLQALQDPAGNAAEAAARAEFSEAWRAALRRLPETYRPVMLLHLEHGLPAKEIAEVLGRPAGTVRTQIVRGGQQLRRLLPAGFAAGGMVLTVSREALARVKAGVWTQAGLPAAAAASITGLATLGALVMKKTVWGALAGLALATWGVISWISERPDDTTAGAAGAEPAAIAAVTSAAPGEGPLEVSREAAGEAPPAAGPPRVVRASDLPCTLAVQVEDADGDPMSGALVLLTLAEDGEVEGRTEDDGSLVFQELPAGFHWIRLAHAAAAEAVQLRGGLETTCTLVAEPGVDVEGLVVGPDGRPVAGARIETERGGDRWDPRALTVTGPDGRFRLGQLGAWYRIRARKDGLQPSTTWRPGGGADQEEVTLRLAEPGQFVQGRVLSSRGLPVPGAEVALGYLRESFDRPPLVLHTDEEGRFATGEAWEGELVVVAAAQDADGVWRRGLLQVHAPDPRLVTVRLAVGATVEGRVTAADGTPRQAERVVCRRRNPEMHDLPFSTVFADTDRDGRYRVEGLLPGHYLLEAGPSQGSVETQVELADQERHRWDPVLVEQRDLRLRVLDEQGQPLVGWEVTLLNASGFQSMGVRTDPEGRGTLPRLAVCEQRLEVRAPVPGIEPGEHEPFPTWTPPPVIPADEEVLLVVPGAARPSVHLSGQVRDETGRPMAGVEVEIYRAGNDRSWWTGHTAEDGTYALGPISPGSYEVYASVPGRPGLRRDTGFLGADARLSGFDLEFAPPVTLTVTLEGECAGAAWVMLERDGVVRSGPVRDGVARLSSLTPGSWSVRAVGETIQPAESRCTLDDRAEQAMRLAVAPGVVCDFTVVLPTDNADPVNWAGTLIVEDAGGARTLLRQSIQCPLQATLTVRRALAPGRYRVRLRDWQEREVAIDLRVSEGSPAAATLDLRAGLP